MLLACLDVPKEWGSRSRYKQGLGSLYIDRDPRLHCGRCRLVVGRLAIRPTTSWRASGEQDPDDHGAEETSGA